MTAAPRLYELLKGNGEEGNKTDWLEVLTESSSIENARYRDPETNWTPLHCAVQVQGVNRTNQNARLGAIRSLLESDLTSTEMVCRERGFTPLMYACMVQDLDDIDENAPVIKLLMEHNPEAFHIYSPDGKSPLDVHIMSLFKIKQEQATISSLFSRNKRRGKNGSEPNCTGILKALLEYDLGGSLVKSLDTLLACNSLEIMECVAEEEARAFTQRLRDRRTQLQKPDDVVPLSSGSPSLQKFWIFEVLVAILHSEHHHTFASVRPVPPFNALHTASQLPDFPPPLLMMCMRAYPSQVRSRSIVKGDLPVHSVASWSARDDTSVATRKSIALTQLLSDHPSSANIRNAHGKTPVAVAIENGSSWKTGIQRLTQSQKQKSLVLREPYEIEQ